MVLTHDWVVKILHVYRESNQVGDWLANKDMDIGLQNLDSPPAGCCSLLLADVCNISFSCRRQNEEAGLMGSFMLVMSYIILVWKSGDNSKV